MASKTGSAILDLEDRDPNNLNQHLQVMWDEVIGEPDGVRSPECAWRVANQCFHHSRNCCYIFLSVLCAPPAALCIGCSFACLAFEQIWCILPCLRMWKISCTALRNFLQACLQATVIPTCEAFGHLFSFVKVRFQQLPEGPDRVEDYLQV